MTEEEALDILWSHKSTSYMANGKVVQVTPRGPEFLYATTKLPVNFGEEGSKKGGTRVIVTMVSRFGDVGIRSTKLDEKRHGYTARVDPGALDDWSTERCPETAIPGDEKR